MRAIIIAMMLLMASYMANADEISADLERITMLVPDQADMETHSSQIAIYFDIPDSLSDKHIAYAELSIGLDFSSFNIVGNRTLEIEARNITDDWTTEDDWNSLADDYDTLSYYTFIFEASGNSKIYLDITKFVKGVTKNSNDNYGLMLIPHKFDQWAFHVNQNIANQIANNANVKIVFH